MGRERQAAAVRGAQAERVQAAAARAEDPARGGRANGGTRQPDRAGTHADDEREGEVDDGAAGATSPAGTADSAEAVRAALGLSPRSPGGRADAAGNPSSPAAFGDVVEPKNAAGVSASRAFANAPANARNAAEWRASLALDPAKARQERQIGDLMASLGLNTRKKRRNLVYPDVLEPSSAAQLAQLADDARMNQAAGQTFERSARVDVASVSARATAFGPAMSPAVAEARAADYPEAGAWGLRAEVARYDEARGGFDRTEECTTGGISRLRMSGGRHRRAVRVARAASGPGWVVCGDSRGARRASGDSETHSTEMSGAIRILVGVALIPRVSPLRIGVKIVVEAERVARNGGSGWRWT